MPALIPFDNAPEALIGRPLVSILIPAYNAEKWVRQSIESALSQTYSPIEIIVIDDGSSDGTVDEILKFGDRIRFIQGGHSGANAARNMLLQAASGEWLQYLDADDYLLPNKVADQINFIRKSPTKLDIVYSPTIIRYEDTGKEAPTTITPPYDATVQFIRWSSFCTHGMLMRRSAVVDAGNWKPDQTVCQEHELVFRLITSGSKFGVWNQAATVYRHHDRNTVSTRNPLQTIKVHMEILDRFEAWLTETGQLNELHRREFYQARMDTARIAWGNDEAYGEGLARKASKSGHYWTTPTSALPRRFQALVRLAGFRVAQKLARLRRAKDTRKPQGSHRSLAKPA